MYNLVEQLDAKHSPQLIEITCREIAFWNWRRGEVDVISRQTLASRQQTWILTPTRLFYAPFNFNKLAISLINGQHLFTRETKDILPTLFMPLLATRCLCQASKLFSLRLCYPCNPCFAIHLCQAAPQFSNSLLSTRCRMFSSFSDTHVKRHDSSSQLKNCFLIRIVLINPYENTQSTHSVPV